jgi:hypothetical protein
MTRLCAKDHPVDVDLLAPGAGPSGTTRTGVLIRQGDTTACDGTIALAPVPDGLTGRFTGDRRGVIDAPLVHKRRADAVLISAFRLDPPGYRADVLSPVGADDHAAHPDTLLLEACRQFAMSSMHVWEGFPLDGVLLLASVEVLMRAPVPAGAEIHLWSAYRPRGERSYSLTAEVRTERETLGTVTMAASGLPKDVYARLRRSGRI